MAYRTQEYMSAYAEHVAMLRGPDGLHALEKGEADTGVTPPALTALRTKREEIWNRIYAAAAKAGQ